MYSYVQRPRDAPVGVELVNPGSSFSFQRFPVDIIFGYSWTGKAGSLKTLFLGSSTRDAPVAVELVNPGSSFSYQQFSVDIIFGNSWTGKVGSLETLFLGSSR